MYRDPLTGPIAYPCSAIRRIQRESITKCIMDDVRDVTTARVGNNSWPKYILVLGSVASVLYCDVSQCVGLFKLSYWDLYKYNIYLGVYISSFS